MPDIAIRPFDPASDAEYASLAALRAAVLPEYPKTANELREEDERCAKSGKPWARFYAVDPPTNAILGMADYGPALWQPGPGKYFLGLLVAPERQGEGIGKALYTHLGGAMAPLSPTWLRMEWREDMARAVRFFTERGFVEVARYYESRLDLRDFDFAPFQADFARPLAHGIVIRSWRDLLVNDPDARHKLWAATMEMSADVPSDEPFTPMPFEQFWSFIMDRPALDPDGFLVAVDSATGEYAGLSHIWRRQADNDLNTGLTGVKRAHRRMGIALALKLNIVRWAVAQGFGAIRTENDISNRPMLAINERLGFQKVPPWLELLWRTESDKGTESADD